MSIRLCIFVKCGQKSNILIKYYTYNASHRCYLEKNRNKHTEIQFNYKVKEYRDVGDLLEQTYEVYTKDMDKYDFKRTMHMGFSGAAVGVLCHHWYKVLDRFIIGKTTDMVIKKLLLDQLIFSPIMIVTFFGSLALLEDNPVDNFKDEVKDKFVTLYKAEWMVWPPAQIINFYFLPTRFRVLYDNTISLGYDIYTSQVKHGKNFRSNNTTDKKLS
ncbi:unnamed protein product [Colias eurytheme]|nr:unnamed protein product [Colias eurytheme]